MSAADTLFGPDDATLAKARRLLGSALNMVGEWRWLGDVMGEVTVDHLLSVAECRAGRGEGPEWPTYAELLREAAS